MKRAEYRYTNLWKEQDGNIIFADYSPNLVITREIAVELVENRIDFSGGKPYYILIDFTNVKSVEKSARDYMNDPHGGLVGILGGAFLSNNIVGNLFINMYLKINKPVIPAKFFKSRDEAIVWLKKIEEEVLK